MKKIISTLLITAFVLFGVFALCACQPGTIEEVEGTYELEIFSRRYPDPMPEVAEGETPPEQTYTTVDYMQEAQVKAYLVLDKDGVGYAVYQDKDTALFVETVAITFSKNDDGKISLMNYTNGYAANRTTGVKKEKDPIPGRGEEQLYVNARSNGVTLVRDYQIYHAVLLPGAERPYSQSVTYRKVDKATDLSFVNKRLNKTLVAPAFELQGLNGVLTISNSYSEANADYIYCAIEIDAVTQKASLYYALIADGQDVVKTDLAVTYRVETTETGEKDLYTIDGKTYAYTHTANVAPTSFTYERTETVDGQATPVYEYYYKSSRSVAEYIAAQKEGYASWLESRQQQGE